MNKSERYLLSVQKALFQIFVFLIPTQLGYHFWFPFSYMFGIRVDYFAPTIYLTDVLLVVIFGLFLWQIIKEKKKPNRKLVTVFILLFSFAAINLIYSTAYPIALYKWIKIIELFLLGTYVIFQKKIRYSDWILWPLLCSAVFFASIGLGQFILQHSIGGPLYYLGERTFSSLTPGIALGDFFGRYLLRAYSTFSHPNSFAGFLGTSAIITYFYLPKNKKGKRLRYFALVLIGFALVATLSRWVWAATLLCFTAYFVEKRRNGLFKKNSHFFIVSAVSASLLFLIVSNFLLEKRVSFSESFGERLIWADRAGELITKNPLVGVGLNNYIFNLPKNNWQPVVWKLQPVHNIFLLTLTETGLVGLGFVSILLMIALKKAPGQANERRAIFWVLVFIVVTGTADHYWLTLQQNQLLMTLLLGVSLKKTGN